MKSTGTNIVFLAVMLAEKRCNIDFQFSINSCFSTNESFININHFRGTVNLIEQLGFYYLGLVFTHYFSMFLYTKGMVRIVHH